MISNIWVSAKIFICAFRMPNYQIPLVLYIMSSHIVRVRIHSFCWERSSTIRWTPNSEQKAHPFVNKTKKSSVMKLNCFFYAKRIVYVERASVTCFTHGSSFVSACRKYYNKRPVLCNGKDINFLKRILSLCVVYTTPI